MEITKAEKLLSMMGEASVTVNSDKSISIDSKDKNTIKLDVKLVGTKVVLTMVVNEDVDLTEYGLVDPEFLNKINLLDHLTSRGMDLRLRNLVDELSGKFQKIKLGLRRTLSSVLLSKPIPDTTAGDGSGVTVTLSGSSIENTI